MPFALTAAHPATARRSPALADRRPHRRAPAPSTRNRTAEMPRIVFCEKLQREAEGLDRAPWPGELGQRIYAHISRDAWRLWLAHQTMLINENRISPLDPAARRFLAEQMERFLFGEGADKPPGYRPPED
jgi:Fe-S cluster biosynthesis and repair protein YggX